MKLFKSRHAESSLRPTALPLGFSVYGLRCGVSTKPGKKDLALFYSHGPARSAGVFTQNLVKAAPVVLSRKHLNESSLARAVLINSGCANACTGARGLADAEDSVRALAAGLGVRENQVLVASTGVIGRYLPRDPMQQGIQKLVQLVGHGAPPSVPDALRAIMTTDTREKVAHTSFLWRRRRFKMWGCAKGAGMIHPHMATMLSVVLTDIGLPPAELRSSLRWAAKNTFNRVSVDGDTSTNDSVFLLANGSAGTFAAVPDALRSAFREALFRVCLSLSEQIASDGEGATRTVWFFIQGAPSEKAAERLAATVATSPLVKTAIHGADPNWGRVLAALGRAGVPFDPNKVDIRFGDVTVCRRGRKVEFSEERVRDVLKKARIVVLIDLHEGKSAAHYVTCDFSKEYISINADYTT